MELTDWLLVALYGAGVLAIGAVVARRSRGGDADDFLLGGRGVPTGAVLLSLVATELSAATFIGVPSNAVQNLAWVYLQFGIGSILARLVLARAVIPLYHRQGVRTVYEFIGTRYGRGAHRATALAFIVGRVLASSVRLYIAALAFSTVVGTGIEAAIIVCGFVAALYSVGGGIRAVIWTDVLQGIVLLAGAGAALVTAIHLHPGGLPGIVEWARDAEAFRWFRLVAPDAGTDGAARSWLAQWIGRTDLAVPAILGGFFLTLATHSTDHDMVQRLLTTRTGAQGARALAWSGGLNVPVVVLFLFLGTALAALDASADVVRTVDEQRRIFPIFVRDAMAAPWRGLVIAGLFAAAMSSLDSAICAIGAAWSVDLRRGDGDGAGNGDRDTASRGLARRSRLGTLVCAGVLALGAISFAAYERHFANPRISLVEVALSAMTIVYGALLGVFAAGFISRRGDSGRAVVALAVGTAVGAFLFLQKAIFGTVVIAWTWWIPIAATVSYGIVVVGARPGPADGGGATDDA